MSKPSALGQRAETSARIADERSDNSSITTEWLAYRAAQLLDRYGVLTREMALAEGVSGGFAGVYPVLKSMEERGHVRRGYFVEGLGAAQFALPGAADRLRQHREVAEGRHGDAFKSSGLASTQEVKASTAHGGPSSRPFLLASSDPAQPYGASLPWPDASGQPKRSAGSYVVILDGEPMAYVGRRGRSLTTFDASREPRQWLGSLSELVRQPGIKTVSLTEIDGVAAGSSALGPALLEFGFEPSYRGFTLRPKRGQ